jgi:hypothetical protein
MKPSHVEPTAATPVSSINLATWIRIAGTLVVAPAILLPLMQNGTTGVIAGVRSTGIVTSLTVVGVFLIAVALYCGSLQRCMELIAPSNRTMKPARVWLMFVPFYNITEDFFIVQALTRSLQNEAAGNQRLKGVRSFGSVSGFGWCTAQVLSLVPTSLGQIASAAAFVLWIAHWFRVQRLSRMLSAPGPKLLS